MRSQCIVLYEQQRSEHPQLPASRYTYMYSTILFQDRGVADLTYTLKVTQMGNNHQTQLLFRIGWLNTIRFGLTRSHLQENKEQNKLKFMKTTQQPDFFWILGFYSTLITDNYMDTEPG